MRALRTLYSGVVQVAWKGVSHARMYIVEQSEADTLVTNNWIQAAATTKTRCEVGDLKPGKHYWFRVRSVGARALGPLSDVALVKAA